MAWFSLRVREVPGSTAGQAPFQILWGPFFLIVLVWSVTSRFLTDFSQIFDVLFCCCFYFAIASWKKKRTENVNKKDKHFYFERRFSAGEDFSPPPYYKWSWWKLNDNPARTWTWNLLIRSQTPYPLGYEAESLVCGESTCLCRSSKEYSLQFEAEIFWMRVSMVWTFWRLTAPFTVNPIETLDSLIT